MSIIKSKFLIRIYRAYMLAGYSKHQKSKILLVGNFIFLLLFALFMIIFFPLSERGAVIRDYVLYDDGNSRIISCRETDRGSIENLTLSAGGVRHVLKYNGTSLDCHLVREFRESYQFKTISGFIVEVVIDGNVSLLQYVGLLRLFMPIAFLFFLISICFTWHVIGLIDNESE